MTIKKRADALRKMLADEYGIMNDEELMAAMSEVKPIPIGVFTFDRNKENKEKNEKVPQSIRVRDGVVIFDPHNKFTEANLQAGGII